MKKSLIKNSIFNVLCSMLNALFPLISTMYASHILLDTGVGKVASAQNIAQYFMILAALGIPNYAIREIAKKRDRAEEIEGLFSELFLINGISTVLFAAVYYLMIYTVPFFREDISLYSAVGLMIVCNLINIEWFYQGLEEFPYIAIRSALVKSLSLAALFIWVYDVNDYVTYALISVFATVGNYLVNMVRLRKYHVHIKLRYDGIRKHMKSILILLGTSFAVELYTLLDTTMLTLLCEPENVAYYSNSMKIVRTLITVITAIGGVLLPRLSAYSSEGKLQECSEIVSKVFTVMLFLFLPCGIRLILVAEHLVPLLFGSSFLPAVETLKIAALLIYALGFSNLFGTQVLLTFGEEKKLFICTVVGALSNICMNMILIPLYQHNGATIASVISESMVTLLSYWFARKYVRLQIERRFIWTSLTASIVMTCLVMISNTLCSSAPGGLICGALIGGASYFLVNYLLKNPIMRLKRR